jgi:exonuclease SbcC
MRPLELRVRNFRSYSGEHVFDFRERTLVGIVGPIGSGKSSILDAVAFALYGRTPRIGAATKTLINQRAGDAGVVLRFVVEGEIWEAARSIRAKGPSKHALYRYAADDPESAPIEKILMEGEVNDRVVQLLGLDFSAFERSVLLAQGRFAEFLQSRPADRDKVLKGVFGHDRIDRMKVLAKERHDDAEGALGKLAARLERFDVIKQRLAENQLALGSAVKRKKKLGKATGRMRRLDETIQAARSQVESIASRLASLEEHSKRLPDPDTASRSLADAAATEQRRIDLAKQLDDAQQELTRAEKALAKANAAEEQENLQRATELMAAADPQVKAVVEVDRRIATLSDTVTSAKAGVATANRGLDDAAKARDASLGRAVEAAKILDESERALQQGRHADMAATLRMELVVEEPCPVCAQLVEDLPEAVGATHIEELEEVVGAARRTKKDVDSARTKALADLERAKEQAKAAAEKLEASTAQLEAARDDAIRVRRDFEETTLQLEKLLGPGDPGENLERRRAEYEALVGGRDEAQRRTDQIRGRHDQSIRDEQQAGKAIQDLGVRLAELAGRLQSDIEIGDGAAAVGAALEKLRRRWAQVVAELNEDLDANRKTQQEAAIARTELLQGLEVVDSLDSALAVVIDRIEHLEAEVARDREELSLASDLYDEQAKLSDRVELFGRINRDLTDSRFVRFLLDEERARLAELGSEHFQQLSAGRYRFADDKFAIVDLTAADVVRRADSLSGGETFLASLGLALALAEMVAGTGGRLDAFFLDEGFGALDPEHLDLAMEGIEQLVADSSDRLVVIVSHVPELRMRMEDLIQLERSPATGDTQVVSS